MKKLSVTAFFVTFFLLFSPVEAHVGGLDKNGGHKDRKNGGYHCHKEPCFSFHQQTSDAVDEAIEEGRERCHEENVSTAGMSNVINNVPRLPPPKEANKNGYHGGLLFESFDKISQRIFRTITHAGKRNPKRSIAKSLSCI